MNEWPCIPIHTDMYECTGEELSWSVMLITRFTRATPWMYAYILTLYTISSETFFPSFMFLHLRSFHFTGFRYVTIIYPWGTATGLLIDLTEPISRWLSAPRQIAYSRVERPRQIAYSRVERSTSNRVFEGWAVHVKSRRNCVKSFKRQLR